MEPFPYRCEECPAEEKSYFGCGDGHTGEAEAKYTNGARSLPYSRTCPQWCARQDGVMEVLADLRDFKRGGLGCVLDLPAPLLVALRVAEAELETWEAELYRRDS